MCWFLWDAMILCKIYPSQTKILEGRTSGWGCPFRCTLGYDPLKVVTPKCLFGLPKSSFGMDKFYTRCMMRCDVTALTTRVAGRPRNPDLRMIIRARNAVWWTKRAIGSLLGTRGFRGRVAHSVVACCPVQQRCVAFGRMIVGLFPSQVLL